MNESQTHYNTARQAEDNKISPQHLQVLEARLLARVYRLILAWRDDENDDDAAAKAGSEKYDSKQAAPRGGAR